MTIQQVVFVALLIFIVYWSYVHYGQIWKNIKLGKEEKIDGQAGQRWKNLFLIALGQKKMFKRFIPAIFHLFIYLAFMVTQIELVEIVLDGILGTHRLFASSLGGFYTFIISFIEVLSVLALIATVIFLFRRNIVKVKRFFSAEMKGWPQLDGNLILIGELLLLIGIFSMNGADTLLQKLDPVHYPNTGNLAISQWLGPALFSGLDTSTLMIIERMGWWLHILVVFGFLAYLPISKHLHILLAFPNVYFSKLKSRGTMSNIPEIMNEVKSMMGLTEEEPPVDMTEIPEFGANDIHHLSWKSILEAYTCTECGRCTSVCPANITGKKLSPRKIMMDVRDRATEVGQKLKSKNEEYVKDKAQPWGIDNFDDGRSLFDYIATEEIYACTTCNACVEACPVLINPMDIILELRRYEILNNSAGPTEWLPMFNSIENSGIVWQLPDSREQWISET